MQELGPVNKHKEKIDMLPLLMWQVIPTVCHIFLDNLSPVDWTVFHASFLAACVFANKH